jgi:hypothetical protein
MDSSSMDIETAMESLHALKIHNDMTSYGTKADRGLDATKQLREQYEAMVLDQTKRSQGIVQENVQLRSMLGTLEHQNQSLRHAVQVLEGYRDKVDEQSTHIAQLQHEIKQLKQANFSLQFYLQQSDHTAIHTMTHRPPDVY